MLLSIGASSLRYAATTTRSIKSPVYLRSFGNASLRTFRSDICPNRNIQNVARSTNLASSFYRFQRRDFSEPSESAVIPKEDKEKGKENNDNKKDNEKQTNTTLVEKLKSNWHLFVEALGVAVAWPLLFLWFLEPDEGTGGVVDLGPRSLFTQFQDTNALYQDKSTFELYFSLLIFKLCKQEWLVNMGYKLLEYSEVNNLTYLTNALYWGIRRTFYEQFCAGETVEEATNTIQRLKKQGITCILDYCSEDAETEDIWDRNTDITVELIKQAKLMGAKYIPLKISAFTSPELLEKLSTELQGTNKEPIKGNDRYSWIKNYSITNKKKRLSKGILNDKEYEELNSTMNRLIKICKEANKEGVCILIDAEQSYRQASIDYYAIELSRMFNIKNNTIIYNTYQCYLKETRNKIDQHIDLSKKERFNLGVKLVRGAYIVSETKLSIDNNYESPILQTKIQTDDQYNKVISILLHNIASNPKNNNLSVVIATHNLESILLSCQKIRDLKLQSNHPNIHFAQLKGMSDYLTYGLSYMNFNANKLIPYGPVKSVIPYLLRRSQENRDIMGGTAMEISLLWNELKRRQFGNNYINLLHSNILYPITGK